MTPSFGYYYERIMRRAIVFAPVIEQIEGIIRCLDYIRHHHYQFVGIVVRDLAEAQKMLDRHTADICIVDQRADLPPAWTPRFEIVAEFPPDPGQIHRRTARIIRPGGAA